MTDEMVQKLLDKQDEVIKELQEIKLIQSKQEENLAHHMYRTELAEENIDMLRKDVEPLKDHVKYVSGILKFLGSLAILATLVASVLEIISRLKS